MVYAGKIDGIADVLSDYKRIRVADYQRNYDWTKTELDDTWRDLTSTITTGKDHFFGSLILQRLGDESCELVDGQQRVTSLFLIAARLRDELLKLPIREIPADGSGQRDINVRQGIEDFLYGHEVSTTKPRFEPNMLIQKLGALAYSPPSVIDQDRDFPRRSREEDKAATLAFRNAYWHVKTIVDKDLSTCDTDLEKLKRIHHLSNALLRKLKVLPITTGDSEESLNVFMTTNDRGLPLGVFDIVRGQVLRALTLSLEEQEKRKVFVETLADWDEILVNLEGSKPDQFLRHYLLSGRSEKITMKALPGVTDKTIDLNSSGFSARAAELWDGIKQGSEIYDQILRPTAKGKTKDRLEALLLLADSYRLLVLRILSPSSKLNLVEQEELIRLTLVAVFKWIIANNNAQEFESHLQAIAKPLWQPGGFKDARKILVELINGFTVDVETFLSDGVSIQTGKAILFVLESELSGKAASLNYSTIHLEHVAPQKSTPDWLVAFEGSEVVYKELVSNIGNMTILDEGLNTRIKQSVFSVKQKSYEQSRSNITNDLVKVTSWNADVISKRKDWIKASLSNILRVDSSPIKHFSEWLNDSESQ